MNILIPVIVAIIIIVLLVMLFRVMTARRRSSTLRERFGSEYDRTVDSTGGRRDAESELEQREERVEALDIRPLSDEDRGRFSQSWQDLQSQFVDDPAGAVTHADQLVADVMETRGYPVGDFDQRAADVSINHPGVVENYRVAHEIAVSHFKGEATTEDLRQAMVHYRALFDDLLGETAAQGAQA